MVLGNQANVSQSNAYSCGTPVKCGSCLYKLICERSPFCCIKNNSTCDLTPVMNALSQLQQVLENDLSVLLTNINSVGAAVNAANESLNSIGSVVNEINSKLDNMQNVSLNSNNSNGLVEASSSVVPYSDDETVLVQKKGIFGKTKWVEEKKR